MMRMWKRSLIYVVAFGLIAGCGAGIPQLVSNTTTLSMQAETALQLTFADQNYNNSTITQTGGTSLQQLGWSCNSATNTYLQCTRSPGGYGGGFGTANCTSQAPCQCQFTANRGGALAYITINVIN